MSKNNKVQILIVDDDDDVRSSLASVLAGDYECIEAENAEHARQQLNTHNDIKIIISDKDMPPGISGIALAKLLKNKSIYFILHTGDSAVESQVTADIIGVDLIVKKGDYSIEQWRDSLNIALTKFEEQNKESYRI